MEIRDRVSDFVGEKIHAIRRNSDGKLCSNVSVVRSNAMKTLTNYIPKQTVSL